MAADALKTPRQKFLTGLRFAFASFGPLIAFYSVNHYRGLRDAIIASTLVSIVEVLIAFVRKEKLTTLFKFCAVMTLVFGAVDLYAQQSILFKYEASVTNLLTGGFFAWSLKGGRSLIQDFYEQRPEAKPVNPQLAAYFRMFTALWVLYFAVKAGVYVWIARHYAIEEGLLIRTIVGTGSLVVFMAISTFGGRPIFIALNRLGFFRVKETQTPCG